LGDPVIDADAFRDQPVLLGDRVRLEPLGPQVLEPYWRMLQDPEGRRLTGTHHEFGREQVEAWLRSRHEHADRADWAVLRREDGEFLGEAVLMDLDPANGTVGYRVGLAGPAVYGRGHGTEVTRLVTAWALDTVGLHRVELEVYAHNPRAQRVYEKCGFRAEGRRRGALLWDGVRHDAVVMGLLRTDPRPVA
jgi:RimJ/RimL family protein N-acetyltransferase